jgi:hypothetical protein
MCLTGWEEKAWLGARASREALALSGMMADAERLYGLGSP